MIRKIDKNFLSASVKHLYYFCLCKLTLGGKMRATNIWWIRPALTLLFYFSFVPQVFAVDWERRATGQTYIEYFGTVVRTGEIASMLMLRDFTSKTDFRGVTVRSIQTERLFNCKENITRVKKYDGFSEEMGMGELVLENVGDNEWEKIEPSTFLEYALRTACLG